MSQSNRVDVGQKNGVGFVPLYSYCVLFLVKLGQTFSYIDRQLVAVLLSPIKAELHLSDTQLGFLSGLSFALFYAVCGVPLARVADKRSRRNLMTVSLIIWSGITTLGGFVQNFFQLLLVRFGVGVGEAGYTPAAFAMIADYFPPRRRQMAAGLLNAAPPIGTMLGLVIGGVVAPAYGWRAAFLVAGSPGVIFAILFFLLVKEPRRGQSENSTIADISPPPILASLAILWRNKGYRYLAIATVMEGFSLFSIATWMPSFLGRSHHLSLSVIGPSLGIAVICGALGAWFGGAVGDRLGQRDIRWPLYVASAGMITGITLILAAVYVTAMPILIGLYGLFYFVLSLAHGPQFALCTVTVPLRLRALAMSVMMFAGATIAFGLGPLATGILSDWLTPAFGQEALRVSIAVMSFSLLLPAAMGWFAASRVKQDMDRMGAGATIPAQPA